MKTDSSIEAGPSEIEAASCGCKKILWTGRVISILFTLFMLLDGVMKVIKPKSVVDATVQLGIPESAISSIGIILLICTVLYAVPRTSVLGAILLTGYLGGAVAAQVRAGESLFGQTFFPVCFAIVMWGGLYLRDRRLRALVPWARCNG